MDGEHESEDVAFELFERFNSAETVGPDVVRIHLGPNGDLLSTSSELVDDHTPSMYYPGLEVLRPPEDVRTTLQTELRELDRLMPMADLVSYQTAAEPG
jgi:hypothetical protein